MIVPMMVCIQELVARLDYETRCLYHAKLWKMRLENAAHNTLNRPKRSCQVGGPARTEICPVLVLQGGMCAVLLFLHESAGLRGW